MYDLPYVLNKVAKVIFVQSRLLLRLYIRHDRCVGNIASSSPLSHWPVFQVIFCSLYLGTLTYSHSPIHQGEVCMHLVGLWANIKHNEEKRVNCHTVPNIVEISERMSKATVSRAFLFHQLWLCRSDMRATISGETDGTNNVCSKNYDFLCILGPIIEIYCNILYEVG